MPAVPSTTSSTPALEAVDLTKTYRTGRQRHVVHALAGVSFAAATGSVFGLLGPNGAGKSTIVKILSTLAKADSGTARVAGVDVGSDPGSVRRLIGFVAQKPVTDPMDTGRENIVLAGRIHGLSAPQARARAAELLERFDLTDAADRLVRTYSGGMARKLDVAVGLTNRPQVLFLDEPTTGLDPTARAGMWNEIERMAAEDAMTVLLTTHYLDEADRLASTLAIVDAGRVVTSGTPDQLKSELHGDTLVLEFADLATTTQAAQRLARMDELRDVDRGGTTIRARADRGAGALPRVLAVLDEADLDVAAASVARPTLDDVYLRHTGRTFADAQDAAALAPAGTVVAA
jgi:ABC-2 type transport system ATP-binding protein